MRIAILSDPHANLRAWNAVLADIANARVDRILCLGDIVGYGPSPVEVLESAYRHVHAFVLGNHDAVVAGKMAPDVFNDRARRLILWTRERIGRRGADFLSSLPLVLAGEGYRCSHANFDRPSAFGYVLEPEDAAASWAATREQLLFVGHTHEPKLFVLGASGTPHRLEPQDFLAEPGKRYIVNVGSVGLPRDADGRASYVIFDDVARTVCFRRVPFDLDAFRADVLRAGLDPADVPLLRNDPRRKLATLREEADFSPATRREEEAQGVVETASAEVASARRTARHWKAAALGCALLVLAGASYATWAVRRAAPVPLAVGAPRSGITLLESGRMVSETGKDDVFSLPDFPAERAADGGLSPWGVVLSDSRRTRLSPQRLATPDSATSAWKTVLETTVLGTPQTVRLESVEFFVEDDRAPELLLDAEIVPGADFLGEWALLLEVRHRRSADFVVQERLPYTATKKSEKTLRVVRRWAGNSDRIRGISSFRIVVEGTVSGTAQVHRPWLRPKNLPR